MFESERSLSDDLRSLKLHQTRAEGTNSIDRLLKLHIVRRTRSLKLLVTYCVYCALEIRPMLL